MYGPFIFLLACISMYLLYRIQVLRKLKLSQQHLIPIPGEDAMAEARIISATNHLFNVSRYFRSIRNYSANRWMTVAIKQVIKTDIGVSQEVRLITNLAPGEERRLGHADDVQEGRYKIFIGYEILWARYTEVPKWYLPKQRKYPTPAEMYDEAMKKYHAIHEQTARALTAPLPQTPSHPSTPAIQTSTQSPPGNLPLHLQKNAGSYTCANTLPVPPGQGTPATRPYFS